MSEPVAVTFEGQTITARRGESLAAALIAAGVRSFRTTRTGHERGLFCGMGVCQECLVEIDGQPNQRACMTKVDRPLDVRREAYGRPLPRCGPSAPPKTIDDTALET